MKLQAEKENLLNTLKTNIDRIRAYAASLKTNGKYEDFETRLSFDVSYTFIGSKTVCDWYRKYDCNDTHVLTLFRSCLRELKVI